MLVTKGVKNDSHVVLNIETPRYVTQTFLVSLGSLDT